MISIISLYSGKLQAPTGVASVIKELDKGKWDLFGMTHQVYTLDVKGEQGNTKISNQVDKKPIIKKYIFNLASYFRKYLWHKAEKYQLLARLYIYIFHEYRSIRLVACYRSSQSNVKSNLIVHDIWSLLALYESGFELNNVVFVVHGSSSPVDFLENIFPSLLNSSTTSQLRLSLSKAISNVRSVVVLSESSLDKISRQLDTKCVVIHNGLEKIETITDAIDNQTGLVNVHITGNVCKRKRQYLIPNILNQLSSEVLDKIQINVFGGGFIDSINRDLSSLALSKKVKFWGNISNPSLHYRTGDLILCISSEEGLPMALIEGIRSGCIPVTVDIGGCNEVVCESGGFLIKGLTDSDVVEDTSRIIEQIVLDVDRNNYASNAIEHFNKKFSNQTMVKKYARLF